MEKVYFIDANIFMYSSGRDHLFKEPCAKIVKAISARKISAVTSTEVVQEILHRYLSLHKREIAVGSAKSIITLLSPLLPVTEDILVTSVKMIDKYPFLNARDALHLASMLEHNLTNILTTDTHFEEVEEINRYDPVTFKL